MSFFDEEEPTKQTKHQNQNNKKEYQNNKNAKLKPTQTQLANQPQFALNSQIKQESSPIENKSHKSRRNRRERKDRVPLEKQEKKNQKRFIFPPLKIKERHNSLNQEEVEQPLEDYVKQIYEQFSTSKKHNKIIQSFLEEDDEGNIEYKLKLVNPSEDRLDHLATQMKFRVKEGLGEAYYRIGVEDNGRPLGLNQEEMLESLKTICYLANKIHTDVMVLRVSEGIKGLIVELIIRKIHLQGVKLEIRLLLFGESGSGKSTLLGVLKSGEKDDGKGYARVKVFTHKHEFMTGATQTKSHHVISFDSHGKLNNQQNMMSLEKWLDKTNKLLTFIDVGGHKKAQKQLVSSLCSFFPEYALWVISGKDSKQKKEGSISMISTNNLELATIFNLPLIVVITHLDELSKDEQMDAIYKTKQVLKKLIPDKTPCVIKEMQYAVLFSRITSTEDVIPIFLISNVTGKNIDLLTNFLNLLTSVSQLKNNEEMNTEFSISDKYVVEGNIILAGTVIKGTIKKGQILHIGPDLKGSFRPIEVISIECLRVPVKLAKCGQICAVAIRLLHYTKEWLQKQPNAIRRGMVLVQSKSNPKAVHQFVAQFTPYSNSKEDIRITQKYQPVINTLTTRQICHIVNLNSSEQKELGVKSFLEKKKSRSIDMPKYETLAKRNKQKLNLNQSIDARKKINSKKSVDLTQQYDYSKINERKLEPIAQEAILIKKKKEMQEIRFSDKEPTTLRLRFKYYPEYITLGQKLVINELKLIGKVREICY